MKLTHSVRRQLRLVFAFVIALSFLSTALAIWHFQALSAETEALVHRPFAKERLVARWLRNLSVSAKRTAAVAATADPDLGRVFAAESHASSERTDALQEEVADLLDTDEERTLFATIVAARHRFVAARDTIMAMKAQGRSADGQALYEQGFTQAAQRYLDDVEAMLTLQQRSIDVTAATMLRQARDAELVLLALCAVTLVASMAALLLFSRALFRRLGSEPAVAAAVAGEIAAGNLGVDIALAAGDQASLLHGLQRMRDGLASIVVRVRQGTAAIGASIDAVAAESQALALRTERQASALEESACSVQQLSIEVRRSEGDVEQARLLTFDAATVARRSGVMVAELVDVMGKIDGSSARIADIVTVIDGIAFQTNLLALNAAVEAARAGSHGRGFAVVATEVRALALRSADAAREIRSLVADSTRRASQGATLADRAGASMAEVVDSVASVTDIMDRIVESAREQSTGIRQIHAAIADMDEATQQNAALAEESAVASQAMREQVADLARQVAAFRLDAEPAPSRRQRTSLPRLSGLAASQYIANGV